MRMDRPLVVAVASLAILFVGAAGPCCASANVYTIAVSGGS